MAIELQGRAGDVYGVPLSKLDCPPETLVLCMIDGTCHLVGTTLDTRRLLLVWFPRFNHRETSEMFREGIRGTGSRRHPPLCRDHLVSQEWGGILYNHITGPPDPHVHCRCHMYHRSVASRFPGHCSWCRFAKLQEVLQEPEYLYGVCTPSE